MLASVVYTLFEWHLGIAVDWCCSHQHWQVQTDVVRTHILNIEVINVSVPLE